LLKRSNARSPDRVEWTYTFGAACGNGADRGLLHSGRKRCARDTPNKKEKGMKRNFFRWFAVSFGAAALAAALYSGGSDRLVVDIPYNFVVNGKTLPAGKYDVRRSSDRDLHALAISSFENHAYAVVLPTDVSQARGSHPAVTLVRTGDQTVLTKIQTAE